MMLTSSILAIAAVSRVVSASTACSSVTFQVNASAENVLFEDQPNPNNATAVLDFFRASLAGNITANGTVHIEGTYHIVGTFCRPPKDIARNSLQILVHGLMYDRSYWHGLNNPLAHGNDPAYDRYDWSKAALAQGYHTLAIDRLGHGQSPERPDPINALQFALHIEVLHNIITSVNNPANPLGRTFAQKIVVGHSYGSGVGTGLVAKYPEDADAFVATGYSSTIYAPAFAQIFADIVPARDVYPRLRALAPGYLAVAHENLRETGFYAGGYDPAVSQRDFQLGDTMTPGEIPSVPAPVGYNGPVLVISGALDSGVCSPAIGQTCEETLKKARELFPNARYASHVVPNTGHDLNLHYSAVNVTFPYVHDWLAAVLGS